MVARQTRNAPGGKAMLERLARWTYRHRRRTVILWIVALVAIIFLGAKAGGPYATDFSLPGTESQQTFDLLKARFPSHSGDTASVAFKADNGVTDPSVKSRMEGLFTRLSKLPLVDSVS